MPVGCAKSILISFNLILWLTGGTLLILGTWIFVEPTKIHLFHFVTSASLDWDFAYYLAYAFLSLGGVTFIAGHFGCCGAVRENRCLLVTYFVSLFILMSIELGIAVTAFIYKDHYLTRLEERLTEQLYQNYGYRNNNEKFITFSEAVDFTQYKFKCCGVRNDRDYINSRWWNESQTSPEKRKVPLQCCVVSDPGEHHSPNAGSPISVVTRVFYGTVEEPWQNPHVRDIAGCQDGDKKARYSEGCYKDIEAWFKRESSILIAVGISSAALQVFGMIITFCMCRSLGTSI
ncbi:UNVERIFIED_CONTAM: hypothetical protein PYX00_002970 [Menopon gallinae]|uniref:Tetraspanin n=1 Tax=Menopon gallinae TaxID=328185 RepID=A0AAW2HYU5_9NEOP